MSIQEIENVYMSIKVDMKRKEFLNCKDTSQNLYFVIIDMITDFLIRGAEKDWGCFASDADLSSHGDTKAANIWLGVKSESSLIITACLVNHSSLCAIRKVLSWQHSCSQPCRVNNLYMTSFDYHRRQTDHLFDCLSVSQMDKSVTK